MNTREKAMNRKEIDTGIRKLLACPGCKGELEHRDEESRCLRCRLAFPRREGIGIFLLDEARKLD